MELSEAELEAFARDFVSKLPRENGSRAHVIGLKGDLGAGKTTFVQYVGKALGIESTMPSPTFTFVRPYAIHHGPFRRLIHVDAYRLSPDSSDTIGWDAYVRDPENLILVEWPERTPGGFPSGVPVLHFEVVDASTRSITTHGAS